MNTCPKCGLKHYSERCPCERSASRPSAQPCPYCAGRGTVSIPIPYEDDPAPCPACGGSGVDSGW